MAVSMPRGAARQSENSGGWHGDASYFLDTFPQSGFFLVILGFFSIIE
jgi:hypothetical protein